MKESSSFHLAAIGQPFLWFESYPGHHHAAVKPVKNRSSLLIRSFQVMEQGVRVFSLEKARR